MARMKEFPRYNVISMRVSDEELKRLENLRENTHKSLSRIMREAIEYFAASREHPKKISTAVQQKKKSVPIPQ